MKTSLQALEYWYNLSPNIFKENPVDFKINYLQ